MKTPESTGLVITLPGDLTTVELDRLRALLTARGALISASLGADRVAVELTEDGVSFPWWDTLPDFENIAIYSQFLGLLIAYAKNISKVTTNPKAVTNEKYAMRSLLYRIGAHGPEHKDLRRALLAPLTGSSAWPTPPATQPATAPRVRLISTDDPYTNLRAGDEGTVAFIDDAGTVHVEWDNGSNLGLVPGVDRWETFEK
ncbi:DUF4314 domain-containing protein [Actinobaculum suis]|uniref:DUF4314 domain-containing protein n=1 Tax=Actinobaculum suis TaxID=1657 RepID=UPI000B2514A9|nr:DUF4314 domain-containing protein [Actinobaculum suis]